MREARIVELAFHPLVLVLSAAMACSPTEGTLTGSGGAGGASATGGAGGDSRGGAGGTVGDGGTGGGAMTIQLPDASVAATGGNSGGNGTAPVEVWPPGPDYVNVTAVSVGDYALGPLLSALGGSSGQGGAGGGGGASMSCTRLFAVIRDFRMGTTTDGHPDFQTPRPQDDRGIVTSTLGDDGKPVYAHPGDKTRTTSGQEAFDQWYRDVDGVNMSYLLGLRFRPTGSNVITFAASIGNGGNGRSYDGGASDAGLIDSSYFPLDEQGFGNQNQRHNYAFTTEIHTAFLYNGGETFTFQGDDDVFVYINGRLAIDLGGIHEQQTETIDLDARADELGIAKGSIYDLAVFNAERHTSQSNFRIDTTMTFTNCGTVNGIIY